MRYIDDITNFIFVSDEPQQADIIFIPGGTSPEIAERAAILWRQEYSPIILPSGKYSILGDFFSGPSSKADIYSEVYNTEWEFLKGVLVHNGVKENAILIENESMNTYENAIYSRRAADRYGLNIRKAIICCKSFHARRCLMYYQILFKDTQFLVCPEDVDGVASDNWYKTDKGIELVLGELSRCGSQFADIFKAFNK
jgi:uncharacterized SAM-binding protein YcdF (DUF218 family)